MSGKYILSDKKPVIEMDLLKWGVWFEKADRIVAKTSIGDMTVSTVFLGIDHNWGEGPPLLFETMIFGGRLDMDYQTRCSTWDQAEAQHAEAVEVAKSSLS